MLLTHATTTTKIHTLSLHDALPISLAGGRTAGGRVSRWPAGRGRPGGGGPARAGDGSRRRPRGRDRKSTRLNSSHVEISYAVFCLEKINATGRCVHLSSA